MNEIASRGQLWQAYLRWSLVTVPFVLLLGLASARFAPGGDENAWFVALQKPAIMPPGIAFPIVWSILYVLMGLALATVVNARGARGRPAALLLFFVQLAMNLAWPPLFFGFHQITAALWLIAGLFVMVLLTTIAFARIRTAAGALLLPYLLWIGFAGVLLYQVHALNPDADAVASGRSNAQIEIH
ncbi:TspO/MBR family protein [Sphingomonas sp. RS6]